MRPIRISIAGLMALVLATAVGLAALSHPTQLWASATLSLALLANFAAVVAAIASEGVGRKQATGFAVFGWGYLALALGPVLGKEVGLYLITTPMLAWCFERGVSDPYAFAMIAHSLFSLAAGLAGATFAWWLAPRPAPDRPTISPTGPL